MERRTFITASAVALTAGAVSACSASDGSASSPSSAATSDTIGSRSASASSTVRAAANLDALAKDLDGSLVRPGESSWAAARQLYNTRFDALKPSAVAYVAGSDDIRTALAYARAHKVPLSIRNGGHSYAGWSSGDGHLILDVSRMKSIRASGSEAVVGAGAKLIDVYRTLADKGVTIPAGSCPTVGISGLTLGGGHGVVSRAYGLTCDSLTQATLITADGKELTANADSEKDLFWALRGAGNGQFGVVTELRFKTHPAPQAVSAYISWPWSKAATVLKAWQKWGPDQPDEIWSSLHIAGAPGGNPTISLAAFSLGTYGELQNAVDRLADGPGGPGPATSVSLKRRSYEESMEVYAGCSAFADDAQCHLPGATPGRDSTGALQRETYAAASDFFDHDLSDAGVRTLLKQLEGMTSGAGSVALTALGGAINRVAPTSTAFVHRRSRMLAQYIVSWRAGASGGAAREWLASTHASMRPYASGAAYQNYTDPTLKDWKQAYYGAAASRLTKVKRKYDPSAFFTFPQSL
ncbi:MULTISPECIES: FAD-binding oxidoreductase [unclassified Streptomyces]|uniref:FAD-binding oxidoreductase n=1 Tax=unclassified Streptomyces TaxID=2593676 RepID=UPI00278C07C1|nr:MULTISPECIES: FAD-binding oxidoreductase [unclassified Streptomyces]